MIQQQCTHNNDKALLPSKHLEQIDIYLFFYFMPVG